MEKKKVHGRNEMITIQSMDLKVCSPTGGPNMPANVTIYGV